MDEYLNKSNRQYKDGIFRLLFNNKEKLLELYNAIEGKNIKDKNAIQIQTLEDALYNVVKNDLAFTVEDKFVVMIEHQSTVSVNIAARLLIYIARVYEKILPKNILYRNKPVVLPTPSIYVLYNGIDEQPEVREFRLSELYAEKNHDVDLELKAKMININYDAGGRLLSECRTINEYSYFVYLVRKNIAGGMTRDEAIHTAIVCCVKANVLKDFLESNGSEVYNMLLNEFRIEDYIKVSKMESYEDGRLEGKREGERKGRLEGEYKGRLETTEEIAKKLKEMGIDPAIIKKATEINI